MTQDKIESRRAFMKEFGKLAGIAAVAASFIATGVNGPVAALNEDSPKTGSVSTCGWSCSVGCQGTCEGSCAVGCGGSCALISR